MEEIVFFNYLDEGTYDPIEIETDGVFLSENKFDTLRDVIDDLTRLDNNWDGYDGIPVYATIAEKAKRFIAMLNDLNIDRISDVFPNPHGTVSIEWVNNNNEKLSLEIGNNSYAYFVNLANSQPKFVDGKDFLSDFGKISNEIDELFG